MGGGVGEAGPVVTVGCEGGGGLTTALLELARGLLVDAETGPAGLKGLSGLTSLRATGGNFKLFAHFPCVLPTFSPLYAFLHHLLHALGVRADLDRERA